MVKLWVIYPSSYSKHDLQRGFDPCYLAIGRAFWTKIYGFYQSFPKVFEKFKGSPNPSHFLKSMSERVGSDIERLCIFNRSWVDRNMIYH